MERDENERWKGAIWVSRKRGGVKEVRDLKAMVSFLGFLQILLCSYVVSCYSAFILIPLFLEVLFSS
jgi:hypothetical protein